MPSKWPLDEHFYIFKTEAPKPHYSRVLILSENHKFMEHRVRNMPSFFLKMCLAKIYISSHHQDLFLIRYWLIWFYVTYHDMSFAICWGCGPTSFSSDNYNFFFFWLMYEYESVILNFVFLNLRNLFLNLKIVTSFGWRMSFSQ